MNCCAVAPAISTPFLYHWFPVVALLLSTLPVLVITGVAGTGLTVTLKLDEGVPLPHVFTPFTLMMPVAALAEKLTVIEFVVAPEAMVTPVGTIQL